MTGLPIRLALLLTVVFLGFAGKSAGQGPAITSLSPTSITAGVPGFTLTVNGAGFAPLAVVAWNLTLLPTTRVNSTQLTASVPAALVASPGSAAITVVSGTMRSSDTPFTVNPPPAITSLTPNSATAGGPAFGLTVNGSGFVPAAVVAWNGSALTTTFVSASQLTASVTADLIAAAGTATVTVVSDSVASAGLPFTIAAPAPHPVLASLSPVSATAGAPAFTLTVNGSGFAAGAAVQWNGTAVSTTVGSASQLTATISAALIANPGTVSITVSSGGVTSNSAPFTISPGPAITTLNPSSAAAGDPVLTLTVTGSGFASSAVIQWNGSALTTTFVSATQLTAAISASLIANAGTVNVTVSSGGATSNAKSFLIAPTISSLSPNNITAGGAAFTLTVNGSGYAAASVVKWNGTTLPMTLSTSSKLTASVAANLIAASGVAFVTVTSGGVASNPISFTIVPALNQLSPNTAIVGGDPFTLGLTGAGFTSAATVKWNSTSLSTTFVSSTELTASVPANLIAGAGTAQVTVVVDGVSSNALNFVVGVLVVSSLGPSTGAASGQPFTLTVNGNGFTSSSVVQWNGTPLPTAFGSASQLTASVPGNLNQNPGSAQVSVVSNGVTSNPIAFALVYPLSSIVLSGLEATSVPTQPLSMNLQLAGAAPTDLQGVLTLSFVPNAAGVPNGYMDPALQFASGGPTFNFTIKAGTTSPTVSIPGIQQGTVAGQITVTLTSLSAGSLNVLPVQPLNLSATVPPLAPVVESCTMGAVTNGAFSVQLDAYSTPRNLASAIYSFTAASGAQITVTGANGGQVTGTSQISVPVTTQLAQWFAGGTSQPNGSVFSLAAPFTLSGDAGALQSVSVTLMNSIGGSAPFSCTR